jgi:hypothetical protein
VTKTKRRALSGYVLPAVTQPISGAKSEKLKWTQPSVIIFKQLEVTQSLVTGKDEVSRKEGGAALGPGAGAYSPPHRESLAGARHQTNCQTS